MIRVIDAALTIGIPKAHNTAWLIADPANMFTSDSAWLCEARCISLPVASVAFVPDRNHTFKASE